MSESTPTTTQAGPDNGLVSHYNVIAIDFKDDANAYPALTKLKELDTQGQLEVEEGLVVQRKADGTIDVKDRVGDVRYAGIAGGGLIGVLVGLLGGPVGVLIGGYTGLLVGSFYDLDESERIDSALGQISKAVLPERNVLLAVVNEPSLEVLEAAMNEFGGTVLRRDVYEVEAEVAAIEEAERKAALEAEKELFRSRREQHRDAAHAKVEQIKAKLSHREKEAAKS